MRTKNKILIVYLLFIAFYEIVFYEIVFFKIILLSETILLGFFFFNTQNKNNLYAFFVSPDLSLNLKYN